jgi:hypothetical protein
MLVDRLARRKQEAAEPLISQKRTDRPSRREATDLRGSTRINLEPEHGSGGYFFSAFLFDDSDFGLSTFLDSDFDSDLDSDFDSDLDSDFEPESEDDPDPPDDFLG